jgi:hypothetical protein
MPGIENHPKVQLFINTVMSRFEFAEAYQETKATVECYLLSILDGYSLVGLPEEEAVDKAIKQVGDPVKMGDELNFLESLHACLL